MNSELPTIFLLALSAFALLGSRQSDEQRRLDNPLMTGKKMTDRSIVMMFIVDGSPEEHFELWSTAQGTRRFFGEDAHIDLRQGGAYEIYFLPRDNPQSDANSTKGARLLWMQKNRELAFEWKAPPFAGELNVEPFPTWVEVSFAPLAGNAHKTQVRVAHHGLGRGENWDLVYEFFVRGWASILYRLDLLCSGIEPERPFFNLK
jgi:uncharacterized protein YndB with AHSA1/START domain